jgi:hypothetical protein
MGTLTGIKEFKHLERLRNFLRLEIVSWEIDGYAYWHQKIPTKGTRPLKIGLGNLACGSTRSGRRDS